MAILKVNNLVLGYENDVVINNISFEVNKKDFILVIGSNGVGKSTLIKGILGIIKPISGDVIYDEIEKNNVGYMPQEAKVDSNFPASVMEIVLSGLINKMGIRPFYNKKDKGNALRALKILHIEDLKNRSFDPIRAYSIELVAKL